VAPGSWTLPSHASFFTGVPPWEHRADFAAAGMNMPLLQTHVVPLGTGWPVLAEELGAEGRATVLVSANPVLTTWSGLGRGFVSVTVAREFGDLPGPQVVRAVADALDAPAVHDGDGLFLFVNLSDPHGPHAGVPPGVSWLPPQDRVVHDPVHDPVDDVMVRYLQGRMDPAAATAHLAHLRDTYDWGIHTADEAVGGILELVRDRGWDRAGMRVIITADHGEMLGEHGALEHGPYLYEGTQRVPILVVGGESPIPRDGPLSAMVVHSLVRTGRLPSPLPAPLAVAPVHEPFRRWSGGRFGGAVQVARWEDADKTIAVERAGVRYDLAADPGEVAPRPLDTLPADVDAVATRMAEPPAAPAEPKLTAALKALGYLE
jgi:hypothetical protein